MTASSPSNAAEQATGSEVEPARVPAASTVVHCRRLLREAAYSDEPSAVRTFLLALSLTDHQRFNVADRTRNLVQGARERTEDRSMMDAFLQEFGLSTKEGVALMCLAEALLRVPDTDTIDDLIADKLAPGDWMDHLGHSDSVFVNASTWALMLTGRFMALDSEVSKNPSDWVAALTHRLGDAVIRKAVLFAVNILSHEFVFGSGIAEGLARAGSVSGSKALYSFDVLGEGARTEADAVRHFESYKDAVDRVGARAGGDLYASNGVSVKLSALHPRYEYAKKQRLDEELVPRLLELAGRAKAHNIHLTMDAEEQNRLDTSLDVFETLAKSPALEGWDGLGLCLQCYGKRAYAILSWLVALSECTGRRFMVRLVKGAYWDTEIKKAQVLGLREYPVFTRKAHTDLSYLACAKKALAHPEAIFPQFATHNAYTVAAVLELANGNRDFEFQRLHGMGESLYSELSDWGLGLPPVRVYAPVGGTKDLLAYLVRRLLENGANTSFVNRFLNDAIPVDDFVHEIIDQVERTGGLPHPQIPLPPDMYGGDRRNSAGVDLADPVQTHGITEALTGQRAAQWRSQPIVGGTARKGTGIEVFNPADRNEVVGTVVEANETHIGEALDCAVRSQSWWDALGAAARADVLEKAADEIAADRDVLLSLLVREAGKTIADAVAEVREAEDFLRYYAAQARLSFSQGRDLTGPTGESNVLSLHGRGVFACISPWNFPLAIFCGQIAGALAAGNAVIAKPAEQTPLIAATAIRIFHESGVPAHVLHLLPGGGAVGARLVADRRVAGVAMTGSFETAQAINRTLADRPGPIVPLIAETGGQNAMFVDSTALPEQAVDDIIASAFGSAGQRCSALRILCVQEEIADDLLDMLTGAMNELTVGDPGRLSTDVGPVIDAAAAADLKAHCDAMTGAGRCLHRLDLDPEHKRGWFVAPHLFRIDSVHDLDCENFGPLLHVVRFDVNDLDRHLEDLANKEFGLTFGLQSRIDQRVRELFTKTLAGNVYVNRNMVGAVVGVQPFGGRSLSGTGPKAGGPHYLHRFATERVLTVNTSAVGGNIDLMSLGDG